MTSRQNFRPKRKKKKNNAKRKLRAKNKTRDEWNERRHVKVTHPAIGNLPICLLILVRALYVWSDDVCNVDAANVCTHGPERKRMMCSMVSHAHVVCVHDMFGVRANIFDILHAFLIRFCFGFPFFFFSFFTARLLLSYCLLPHSIETECYFCEKLAVCRGSDDVTPFSFHVTNKRNKLFVVPWMNFYFFVFFMSSSFVRTRILFSPLLLLMYCERAHLCQQTI